jgi:hypothetical protein
MSFSRRDLLKSLSVTALAGSAFRGVSLEGARLAHGMVSAEKSASASCGYHP